MTKAKETALTVVASHALEGSLDEKVRAFDQMGAAMAQLQINGWDTVGKCKAGFWLADGAGEHPAVFVQNHYVMVIKGRLTVEPKWEYMVRKLKETVPGFRFKVLVETDDCARIEMTDGVDTHVVEYTLADAQRQGLLGPTSNNAWSTGSTREMCFKQAVKRCARRLGVGRAVPWVETQIDVTDDDNERDPKAEAEREISNAVVVDDDEKSGGTAAVVAGEARPTAPGDESPVAPAKRPAVMRLSDALVRMYGKQKAPVMLQKATLLYNEMVEAETGTNPGAVFKRVEDIGPVDAERLIEFLGSRGTEPAPPAEPAPVVRSVAPDVPPPAEDPTDYYFDFARAVERARKVFGRKFLVEAPIASGKFWFVDTATFSQAGHEGSIKVMAEDGQVVAPQATLEQLTKIMIADCDAAERGGR